jgi:hypothetical protein
MFLLELECCVQLALSDCPHPFKHPSSGGGSLCVQWVGTHQHPAIPNFDLKIERSLIDF